MGGQARDASASASASAALLQHGDNGDRHMRNGDATDAEHADNVFHKEAGSAVFATTSGAPSPTGARASRLFPNNLHHHEHEELSAPWLESPHHSQPNQQKKPLLEARSSSSQHGSMSETRKRVSNSSRNGGDAVGSPDEHAPIMGGPPQKDYQSISPSLGPAVASSPGENGQNGNAADADSREEREREHEAQEAAANAERNESSKWRQFVDRYGTVELENKGSVARDHMALERTFLAWLRTSLSFASIGIAITQLFRLNTTLQNRPDTHLSDAHARLRHVGKPLGAAFIAISIVVLFIGFHRYFETQHYVIRGKYPASRGSILFVALIAGCLIVSSLVVVLAIAPAAFER